MSNVNTNMFYQAATLLNDVVAQATGRSAPRPIASLGEFVSVATTALQQHRDPVMNALTQMWGRTIFAVRPYTAKLRGLEMDLERWGNVIRKISFADQNVEEDQRFRYPAAYSEIMDPPNGDGKSVDMWRIHKDQPLQTQFYGQSVYQDVRTEFINSLDSAFRDPEEFMRYNAAAIRNRQNKLEQYRENTARAVLLNLICSLYYIGNTATGALLDQTRCIHLITEYNATTHMNLSATDVMAPDNYPGFMRWVYARLATLMDMMASRSSMYQTRINNYNINRHTDAQNMSIYILSEHLHQMDSMARSVTFHEDLLKLADVESVAYWQNIKDPGNVNSTSSFSLTNSDGSVITVPAVTGEEAALIPVFGVVMDKDAAGYAFVNRFDWATPGINAAGGYYNTFHHANVRCVQDTTEKSVLLLMD